MTHPLAVRNTAITLLILAHLAILGLLLSVATPPRELPPQLRADYADGRTNTINGPSPGVLPTIPAR